MKIKRLTEDNLVARALAWLAGAVLRYPRFFIGSQLLLFVVCVLITVRFPGMQFDMRQDNLVGANKKYHQNFLRFKKEFPTQDDLVVVVESEDPAKNRQFVERLGAKLDAETNLFHDVMYRSDLKMLGSKALLFVPEEDLKGLHKMLADYRPFLSRFTNTTNLLSLFEMVNAQFRTAKDEENAENLSLVKALPALERIVREATDSLRRPGTPPSPGISALFNPDGSAEQQVYITFDNGRLYLVTAQAPTEDLNTQAVERLRALIEETKVEVPGLNVGLTGEPVIDYDQMAQSQKDATLASVASLVICALIFIYGYQQTGRPIKATLCLIVGVAYTLAFATLTVGHLNILTITFVPMLIGLAIDYGVHLISRYEEELHHGKSEQAALTRAMVYTGQGVFTGAFTTAGAFLAMCLTNFKGIQEMGIICGGGLAICLIPMLTMLPALLLKGRQNVIDHKLGEAGERRARIENFWLQRPVWVVALTLGLCCLAATQLRKVYFDYNLLHMQSPELQAVELESKLIYATNSVPGPDGSNAPPKSVLYAAVIATNLEQAAALEQQLTNLPAVAGVESMTRFLSEDQTAKLALVGDIKQELATTVFAEPDRAPADLKNLSITLYSLQGYLGAASRQVLKSEAASRSLYLATSACFGCFQPLLSDEPPLSMQLLSLQRTVMALRKEMAHDSPPGQIQTNAVKLGQFQQALFDDVRDTFDNLRTQDNRAPLRAQDLPQALHDRFIGVTGKYLLMVNPRKDLWDRANQREFIEQIEPVYPDLTGTPVQLYHYTDLLKQSYVEAAQYSLAAIVLLILFHFRSLTCVVLALLPVGIGSLWLGGLMGCFDVPLNPANIMTLPLLIGIGVTNGIHILNRFAEEQTPSIFARSTGKAVLVSGLTTIAGFGCLILGKHQGLQSLGYIMSTGLAACMVAGLLFLPALLNLLVRQKPPQKDTTQYRQCTIDTGSGGTEVKASSGTVRES